MVMVTRWLMLMLGLMDSPVCGVRCVVCGVRGGVPHPAPLTPGSGAEAEAELRRDSLLYVCSLQEEESLVL